MARTSKSRAMEREYLYRVYYGGEFVKVVVATTKWHAVELVYSRLSPTYPNIERGKIKAVKS
jgi:ribosomal protein L20A (L18A)